MRAICISLAVACYLTKSVGRCQEYEPRFFYNYETRSCEEFDYGGCKGNANNFETLEACENKCTRPLTPGIVLHVTLFNYRNIPKMIHLNYEIRHPYRSKESSCIWFGYCVFWIWPFGKPTVLKWELIMQEIDCVRRVIRLPHAARRSIYHVYFQSWTWSAFQTKGWSRRVQTLWSGQC